MNGEPTEMHAELLHAGFREFRPDGWPLCPRCEEDEVYTLADDQTAAPRLEDLLRHAACYHCGQLLPHPVPVVRPANLVEMVERIHQRIDRHFDEHNVLPDVVELTPAEWGALAKWMRLAPDAPLLVKVLLSYRGRLFTVQPATVH